MYFTRGQQGRDHNSVNIAMEQAAECIILSVSIIFGKMHINYQVFSYFYI